MQRKSEVAEFSPRRNLDWNLSQIDLEHLVDGRADSLAHYLLDGHTWISFSGSPRTALFLLTIGIGNIISGVVVFER